MKHTITRNQNADKTDIFVRFDITNVNLLRQILQYFGIRSKCNLTNNDDYFKRIYESNVDRIFVASVGDTDAVWFGERTANEAKGMNLVSVFQLAATLEEKQGLSVDTTITCENQNERAALLEFLKENNSQEKKD